MSSSFVLARLRQCAFHRGHIDSKVPSLEGTLAKPGEYDWTVLPLAHPSPQPKNGKSVGSVIFAQLTAESPYTLQLAPLSPKVAHSHGGIWTHLIYDSLDNPSP